MFESFILGAVQGVAEWLPISSEAMVVLVKNNLFHDGGNLSEHIREAIFLHLGTLIAAVVYFWPRLKSLFFSLLRYKKEEKEQQAYLLFIIRATLVSGLLGLLLLELVDYHQELFSNQQTINLIVAGFLFVTAFLLYLSEQSEKQGRTSVSKRDALLIGLFQGFAAIPGISRSGSTVAGMGLLGFNKVWALETSFILSIPLVFLANVVLNYQDLLNPSLSALVAIASAFVFGLATISLLLKLVKKIRFSYFVGIFGLLLLIFTLTL